MISTQAIILRTVKYGESSLILTALTEKLGLQSYIIGGVRGSGKSAGKSIMYQPGAILEMVVYHREQQQLHRIREARWAYMYAQVFSDVHKHAVALFMIELLQRCLKQPEENPDLYYFTEDALKALDRASPKAAANMALFFAWHLTSFFGFRLEDTHSPKAPFLDLQEGQYASERPMHQHYLEEPWSGYVSLYLKCRQPGDLEELSLNQDYRRRLTEAVVTFYKLHVPDFTGLRTLQVLNEVFG